MNSPRLIFWLRVTVSAFFALVCVWLVGLWVRSYRAGDTFKQPEFHYVTASDVVAVWTTPASIGLCAARYQKDGTLRVETPSSHHFGFAFRRSIPFFTTVLVPHWFLLSIATALAFVPWLPWHKLPWSTRYSLRTLLIVTTLVASALGLGAYLLR